MLFALSVCEAQARVILDDDVHGEVLKLIEANDWQAARAEALKQKEMNLYFYRPGHGWMRPKDA